MFPLVFYETKRNERGNVKETVGVDYYLNGSRNKTPKKYYASSNGTEIALQL